MPAVIDLGNAAKGAIVFSDTTAWDGIRLAAGYASLNRPQVPKEVEDGQARPE